MKEHFAERLEGLRLEALPREGRGRPPGEVGDRRQGGAAPLLQLG